MDIHIDDLYPYFSDGEEPVKFDTLQLSENIVSTLWGERQTYNLILLCMRHNVECIHIVEHQSMVPSFFAHTSITDIQHLPVIPSFFHTNLQAIMISAFSTGIPRNLGMLFLRTAIWSIIFVIGVDVSFFARTAIMDACLKDALDDKWLTYGSSVVEVRFELSDETILNPPASTEWTRVKSLLKHNLGARWRCQMGAILFLTKRIVKGRIDRNICKLIASMIWSTRRCPEWRGMRLK